MISHLYGPPPRPCPRLSSAFSTLSFPYTLVSYVFHPKSQQSRIWVPFHQLPPFAHSCFSWFPSQFCLSLDNSSSNTSSSTIHLNRWSEVVPPKAALTFAALWDPDEGMVTFSGAALLESESSSGIPPLPDIFDNDNGHSQFITVDQESDSGTTTSENTPTLVIFQDAFKAFLHRTPSTTWDSRRHAPTRAGQGTSYCLQSRASSTFDGLDVYSHDIQIKPKRSLKKSSADLLDVNSSFRTPPTFGKLRIRSDLMVDSYRPESEVSESSSRSRPSYLVSPPHLGIMITWHLLIKPTLLFLGFIFLFS